MNSTITKDVFPFYVNINNKYLRINTKAIPSNFNIETYKDELDSVLNNFKNNSKITYKDKFPKEIIKVINNFIMSI